MARPMPTLNRSSNLSRYCATTGEVIWHRHIVPPRYPRSACPIIQVEPIHGSDDVLCWVQQTEYDWHGQTLYGCFMRVTPCGDCNVVDNYVPPYSPVETSENWHWGSIGALSDGRNALALTAGAYTTYVPVPGTTQFYCQDYFIGLPSPPVPPENLPWSEFCISRLQADAGLLFRPNLAIQRNVPGYGTEWITGFERALAASSDGRFLTSGMKSNHHIDDTLYAVNGVRLRSASDLGPITNVLYEYTVESSISLGGYFAGQADAPVPHAGAWWSGRWYVAGGLSGLYPATANNNKLMAFDDTLTKLWQVELGANGDAPFRLATDASGVYVAGALYGDPGSTYDLVKFDHNGNLLWKTGRGGLGNIQSLCLSEYGHLYVCGY